jgi:hypothetical protein
LVSQTRVLRPARHRAKGSDMPVGTSIRFPSGSGAIPTWRGVTGACQTEWHIRLLA